MSVWDLLGFGTNWDRVQKLQERDYLENIARIIHKITCLINYNYDMNKMLNDTSWGQKPKNPEKVYKIIKAFGKEIPTKTKYDKFKDYISISDLVPSARQVKKDEDYQKCWDIAYEWAMEYEKNSVKIKNTKLQQENNELKKKVIKLEERLCEYENQNNKKIKKNSKSVASIFYPDELEE